MNFWYLNLLIFTVKTFLWRKTCRLCLSFNFFVFEKESFKSNCFFLCKISLSARFKLKSWKDRFYPLSYSTLFFSVKDTCVMTSYNKITGKILRENNFVFKILLNGKAFALGVTYWQQMCVKYTGLKIY